MSDVFDEQQPWSPPCLAGAASLPNALDATRSSTGLSLRKCNTASLDICLTIRHLKRDGLRKWEEDNASSNLRMDAGSATPPPPATDDLSLPTSSGPEPATPLAADQATRKLH
ncbi:hypothetical protein BKA70DRAFT_1433522 [Coprinopsis sp. MPI-PUGE-AT-0042]|nr:hypothetical protein BKA70DRAFT_1433522 [Coprinopsis sp. MPI-PUGE-AT-0042]